MKLQSSAATTLLFLPLIVSSSAALPGPRRHRTQSRRIHRDVENRSFGQEERLQARAGGYYMEAYAISEQASSVTSAPVASSSSYTGIPVATSTAPIADSLAPFSASSATNVTSDSNATGVDSVPANPANIDGSSLSSILAATSAYNTFSFTNYVVPTSTSFSFSTPSVIPAADHSANVAPAPTPTAAAGGSFPYAAVISAAQAYANSLMNDMMKSMPTVTLEMLLIPTQVSSYP